ncbi:MAG: phage major capsid protein [Clostridia bacterium]|nr:phage major capsid protein [Clostridia bacterium]
MVTMQSADNALKSFYLDAVTDAIDLKSNAFLASIQHSTADVYGKDVRKLVRYGVNGGVAAGSETGDLPTAEANRYALFVSTLKNLYGTIEISDKAMKASQNNEGAFVNLLNDEMEGVVNSAKFHFGRMLHGDGQGYLGKYTSASTGNVLKVNDTKAFVEGMRVNLQDDSGMLDDLPYMTVVAVDRANGTVKLGGADYSSALTTGTIVTSADAEELTGLKAIFEADEIYGLKKSEYPFLKPYDQADVGEIDELTIQTAIDKIEESSGSSVNFILCSWGVRRALIQYYKQQGIATKTVEIEGGFKAISFNGIPVVADRFCAEGTMYLLNTNDFKLYQLCDWQWMESEDGKILRQVPGKPVYTATIVKYAELICEKPNGQGRLTGITEA